MNRKERRSEKVKRGLRREIGRLKMKIKGMRKKNEIIDVKIHKRNGNARRVKSL